MHCITVKLQKKEEPKDLKIIYKEIKKELHEIEVARDDLIKNLGYFKKKQNEINFQSVIYIEEDINFDNFREFISSIEKSEITLNDNNYQPLFYLSCKYEYDVLRNEIEKFISTRPDIENTIRDIISDSNSINDSVDINEIKEELIAKNLDISIKTGLLSKIPLNNLIKILNSPKREIKDYHLLFSFVMSIIKSKIHEQKSSVNNEEIQNLSILPSCLDFCLMSNIEISELFEIENQIDFIPPQNSKEKIKMFINNEEQQSQKLSEIEKRLSSFEELIKNMNQVHQQENEKLKEKMKTQEEASTKIINELQKRLSVIEEFQNSSKIAESQFKNKHENIDKEINEVKKQINEHEAKIKDIQNKFINSKENSKKGIISCQEGIINHLYNLNNKNPVDAGLIKLSGNTYSSYTKKLPKIFDPNWTNDWWRSNDAENSYIKIEFQNLLVKIDKYKLVVGTINSFSFNSWTLTGITEDNQSITLDDVNSFSDISNSHLETTKSTQVQRFVHSIQLTMKGKSSNNDHIMVVRHIELYGEIQKK